MIRLFSSVCLAAVVTSIATAQCAPSWLPGSGRTGPPYSELFAVHDAGNGATLWAAQTWNSVEHPLWFWNGERWEDSGLESLSSIYRMASVRINGHPALMVIGNGEINGQFGELTAVYQSGAWTTHNTPGFGMALCQSGDDIFSYRQVIEQGEPQRLCRWSGTEWDVLVGSETYGWCDQIIDTPLGIVTALSTSATGVNELRLVRFTPGSSEWEILGVMPYDPYTYTDWTRLCWYQDRLVVTGFFDRFSGAEGPVVALSTNGWESLGFDAGGQVSGAWVVDDQLVVSHARYDSSSPSLLTLTDHGWIPYLTNGLGEFSTAEQHGTGWITLLAQARNGSRDQLIAAGYFTRASRTPAMGAAFIDRGEADWEAYGTGTAGNVTTLASTDLGLVALGSFTQLENTAVSLGAIQRNHTTPWEPLIHSIRYDQSHFTPAWAKPITFQGALIVAGSFLELNGTDANYIAAIQGTSTTSLSTGMRRSSSNFSSNDPPVIGLTEFGSDLIAYGTFSEAGGLATGPLAAWNGQEWRPIGNVRLADNWPPQIRAATTFNGQLVIAGSFDFVDGVAVKNVARFDGESWHEMGDFSHNGTMRPITYGAQLIEYQHRLLLSSGFWFVNDQLPLVHEWDGARWIPFPIPLPGIQSPSISHIAIVRGELLICGSDRWNTHFALLWNGNEWRELPEVHREIIDSAVDGDTLAVCGYFSGTATGASQSLARLTCFCAADFNADSMLDITDYLDFIGEFSASTPVADFNSDGSLDLFDYLDFVRSFAAGC